MSRNDIPQELPIRIAPELGDRTILRNGIVYVGSIEALRRAMEEANPFVIVRTSPPCLMNRETGELLDGDDALLKVMARSHRDVCSDPNCPVHEALGQRKRR